MNLPLIYYFNRVYPAAFGDPAHPVIILNCSPFDVYVQRELLMAHLLFLDGRRIPHQINKIMIWCGVNSLDYPHQIAIFLIWCGQ